MAPRITLNLTSDGELEVRLNEEGRERFVRELLALNKASEHFHMGTFDGVEVEPRSKAYRASDKIIHAAKVLQRTDEWDLKYYPHVMGSGRSRAMTVEVVVRSSA